MEGVVAEKRIEENRQRILDVAQEFVDRFTSPEMVSSMPPVIRYEKAFYFILIILFTLFIRAIAAYTAQHAAVYYPNNLTAYLSGFILLRYLVPSFGLILLINHLL